MNNIALTLILIGSIVGRTLDIPLGSSRVPLLDIAVALTVIAFFGQLLVGKLRFKVSSLPTPFWWLLVFVGFAIFSLILAASQLEVGQVISSSLYLVRLISYLALAPIFYVWFKGDPLPAVTTISYAGIAVTLLGLLQLLFFPDLGIFEQFGWDPHFHRLVSTFFDPNLLGIWFVIILTLALSASYRLKGQQVLASITLGVVSLGLFLTYSRSSLLAAMSLAVILIARFFPKWLFLFFTALLCIIIFSPTLQARIQGIWDIDNTVKHRIESFTQGINIVRQHPVFGVGYNTLSEVRYQYVLPGSIKLVAQADSGFDSSLLTLFATTGMVGLMTFLLFVFSSAQRLQRKSGVLGFVWLLATLGLFIASLFVNAWLYPPVLALWSILLGLALKEYDLSDPPLSQPHPHLSPQV